MYTEIGHRGLDQRGSSLVIPCAVRVLHIDSRPERVVNVLESSADVTEPGARYSSWAVRATRNGTSGMALGLITRDALLF